MRTQKLLSTILAVIMVIGLIPCTVFANETAYVAEVDGTGYSTLLEAVDAANEGQIIKLLDDYSTANATETTYYVLPKGATLDLNGYKLTTKYVKNPELVSARFAGENVTICNGTIEGNDNYALYINDYSADGITTSMIVENVTTKGGISVYGNTEVILRNNNVTNPKKYYAVYTGSNAKVKIESGTYDGGTNNTDLYESTADGIVVSGGTFANGLDSKFLDPYCIIENNTVIKLDRAFTATADKSEVIAGEDVTITVDLTGTDLVGAQWQLSYDQSKFTYNGDDAVDGVIAGEWESAGNPINEKELATYTFTSIVQDENNVSAKFDVTYGDAWDYSGAMSGGEVNAALIPAVATINFGEMTASVEVDGDVQTENSMTGSYKEDGYTVTIIPSEADAVVTMNETQVNFLKFTEVGEHVISYTVTKAGYITVTDTFTLTINPLDMEAPVMVNGTEDSNVEKIVTYTEADSYAITINAPEGAVTALELNDVPTTADQLNFNMPGTYKIDYTVTKTGYKTVTGTYTFVINKAAMTASVSVSNEEQDGTSKVVKWHPDGYTVEITPSVADATVTMNETSTNTMSFVDSGNYVVNYTVTKPGYEDVSGTFTLTIEEIAYVVEVNLNNSDIADYVAGKKIVLVYTDNDYVSFTYGDKTMLDVTSRGYKYNDVTEYANVFAIIVDAIDTDAATEGKQALLSDYEANVSLVKSEVTENYVVNYSTDLNKDNKLTLRDVSVAYGVVNQYEPYFIDFMSNVLMADINGDKVADDNNDAKLVHDEYIASKNK